MDVTDAMVLYKRAKTEREKRSIIDKIRLDFLLMKEVLEELESVLYIIDTKHYSTLLEAIYEHSSSATAVEKVLPFLIKKVSFYHLKYLIETLQTYYPSIPVTKYQKLCDKRLVSLCKMSAIAEDYQLEMNCDDLKQTHATGILKKPLNYYLIDEIIISRLKDIRFSVSFKGKNKQFKEVIHAFVNTLQLEAREDGFSDEIIYLGEGAYSIVLQIGNQVLKLGKRRKNNELPYSPELVQWRYRKYFQESGLFIEVQPLLDMTRIKEENVLSLAISSYRNGYYWSDAWCDREIRLDNVGRLLADNVPKEGELNALARMFMGRNKINNVIYKKGDYVIADTDYYEELNDKNFELATDEYNSNLSMLLMMMFCLEDEDSKMKSI